MNDPYNRASVLQALPDGIYPPSCMHVVSFAGRRRLPHEGDKGRFRYGQSYRVSICGTTKQTALAVMEGGSPKVVETAEGARTTPRSWHLTKDASG